MKPHILLLLLLISATSCRNLADKPQEPTDKAADSTDLVLRISRQSRLYTAECKVHKVVTHQDLRQWKASILGYEFKPSLSLGNRKIAIPIDVTLRVYIDFSTFNASQVKRAGKSIHITLPNPRIEVVSSRVNHKGIRQYADLTRSEYTDEEMTEFTRQGIQSILRQVPEMGVLETARANAEDTLLPLLVQLGYAPEDIRISFEDHIRTLPLEQLYDREGSVIHLTKE